MISSRVNCERHAGKSEMMIGRPAFTDPAGVHCVQADRVDKSQILIWEPT